jgi:hypothetical protein
VIERRHLAGELERRRLGEAEGDGEAKVLGRRGERRDDHHRIVGRDLQAELLVELGAAA